MLLERLVAEDACSSGVPQGEHCSAQREYYIIIHHAIHLIHFFLVSIQVFILLFEL